MKLNLGCGNDIKEGYINIDIRTPVSMKKCTTIDFMMHDLKITLPVKNNTADYILAKDVLEHFSWRDTERIFTDWVRVLKKKGKLRLVVPNIDVHIKWYLENKGKGNGEYKNVLSCLRGNLFGGQDYSGNFHKTCFNPDSVKDLFKKNKLYMIEFDLSERAVIAVGEKK